MTHRVPGLVLPVMLFAGLATAAAAADVQGLTGNGFEVVAETAVSGDFNGCEQNAKIPLMTGGVFVCKGFGYMHAHNPKAVLMQKKDSQDYKLLINGSVFDGAYISHGQ